MIKVGTDCSGIEAPIEALEQLGIEYEHVFSSEIDKFAIQSLKANYSPGILYGDITKRDVAEVPYVDLYVAGFPCQPFSAFGKNLGFNDMRGIVFFNCMEYIKTKMPAHFILENVKNILKSEYFDVIGTELEKLKELGYNIDVKVLNTCDFGIPQHRERVYIVGSRMKDISLEFVKVPMPPVLDFVDHTDNTREFNATFSKIKNHINERAVFINLSYPYGRKYGNAHIKSCTIVASSKLWNCVKHRKANITELLMLQGFRPTFKQVVSDTQLRRQIGNSMSVNVLKLIIDHIFTIKL